MEDTDTTAVLSKSGRVDIDIGNRVFMDINGKSTTVTGIFIGMLKNRFLLTTVPNRYEQVKSGLVNGNTIKVKYLYNGAVFAFKTKVMGKIVSPVKALVLAYPKVVQQQALRENKRNEVKIPGRVKTKRRETKVVIFDINRTGCCFKIPEPAGNLAENDTIRLYCKFPGIPDESASQAVVRNLRKMEKIISIGTEFIDPPEAFQDNLTEFLVAIEDFS